MSAALPSTPPASYGMDSATATAAAARAAAALSPRKRMKTGVPTILSVGPWASKQVDPLAKTMPVTSPTTGEVVSNVQLGSAADVDRAVAAAKEAHPAWAALTSKRRAAIMLKFHGLCMEHEDELVELIMKENGKNRTEALGDLAKGLETVEWACSIPQHAGAGRTLSVSGGIVCQEIRDPVGVVACVVPFNFPFMVPMWTTPIALVCGDAVVLKPSEKVPMTMNRVANLLYEAGVPPAVFQLVQGAKEVVDALCDHPDIAALTFVGSSKVAKLVYERAKLTGKKALALGACPKTLTWPPVPKACAQSLCPKPVPKACAQSLPSAAGHVVKGPSDHDRGLHHTRRWREEPPRLRSGLRPRDGLLRHRRLVCRMRRPAVHGRVRAAHHRRAARPDRQGRRQGEQAGDGHRKGVHGPRH